MGEVTPGCEHVVGMLRADHGRIKELLMRLMVPTDSAEQDRVLADLFLDLRIHSIVEQQVFYPSLAKLVDPKQMAEFGKDLYFMLSLMLELESTSANAEPLESTLAALLERFELHVKKDERVFRQLDSWAADLHSQLNSAADKMQTYRSELRKKLSRKISERRPTLAPISLQHTRCA